MGDLAARRSALALLIGTAVALAGCSKVQSGTAPSSGALPGVVRIVGIGSNDSLIPELSASASSVDIGQFWAAWFFQVNERGDLEPELATEVPTPQNGGVSADGLTITYHLRPGVRWHDGAPFTSRDVAFTYHAIMNPATNVTTRHGWDDIARVDTPDAYTVRFRLKRPFAPAVHTFFAHSDQPIFVLPAHVLEREPNLNRVAFNDHPIGTGPFRFVRWVRGDRIEYVANDGYYRGKPKLRSIVLHIVPDENTIVNQLRAHEIDWFVNATPRVYPQLTTIPGVEVRLVPLNANDAVMFNTTRPPFDEANVRRAIGLAIDKQQLVRKATFGTTVAATEDLPPFLWAFDPHAGTAARDLPEAKRLLDAAGWRAGRDGIRVKNGRRFVMGLAYRTDSATDRETIVSIAAMLHEAGIDVELKGYTTALLYGGPGIGVLADGKYDAALQTWYAGTDPDDSTQLTCDQVAPKGYNWARYCNPAMDAAQRVALTHYDRPTRKRAYARIEQLLARDAPFVYRWWPRQIQAVNTDFQGFRPNGIIDGWNAWEWSI